MIDTAVVGGSFAGLSAALQLCRASRSVVVIDDGRPRNRTSPAAHGIPGWDGVAPAEILARFRADLSAYPTARIVEGRVVAAKGGLDTFTLSTDAGQEIQARRLILAHGLRDRLPELPGLAEGWGRTVLHCPYCHGYEVKGRPLAVLASSAMAAHQAQILRADGSDDVTLLVNGAEGLDIAALEAAGIKIERRRPISIAGEDTVQLRLADGPDAEFAALFLAPAVDLSGTPAETLGVGLADGPMGPFVRVGPIQQTDIAGVFAAGDLSSPMWNLNFAVGDGTRAGIGCHQSLLFPDFIQPLEKAAA